MNYLVVLMSLKQSIKYWDMNLHPKYSILVDKGVEWFYEAYDQGGHDCLYELLIPRVKRELCYIDNVEPFQSSCYDDIIEHIRYNDVRCCNFNKLLINYSKTIE